MLFKAMLRAGELRVWKPIILATMAVGIISPSAHAVTPADVSSTCGRCHGLTVNGVVVAAGPGMIGFTAYVSGRDQATWVTTITRMMGYGASVSDVNGTAAYLAGLGAQPATPTSLPTAQRPTATSIPTAPPARPTPVPTAQPPTLTPVTTAPAIAPRPRHSRNRRHGPGRFGPTPDLQAPTATLTQTATPAPVETATGTPTATPSPTVTPNPTFSGSTGGRAYYVHCASCHEPASPGFVGQTIYGASAQDIMEAIGEVVRMQFLRAQVGLSTAQDIAAYLQSINPGGGQGDGGNGRDD